jgi:hypothetical protein
MESEELTKLIEGLGELGMSNRSGAHWGTGGTSQRNEPVRNQHPLDGLRLGVQDAMTQARLAAEQALLCGPGANLPRLKPTDGTFAMLLHPNGNGCMEFIRGFYYSVGHLIEPIDWRNRAALLEWQAFADQTVMVCIPENSRITEWSKRNSERRRIVGNDFRGVYLDAIVTVGGPAVREYAVSFAFPRK